MIEAKNLIKDYGNIRAVDDLSFQVLPGEVVGFLGPNGAGKSTTMKMLTGFIAATSGSSLIGGLDVTHHPVEASRLVGYLPESNPLYTEMTVAEFLRFAADLRLLPKNERDEATQRVINACKLESVIHQTIDTLSKGFRRRVGLAQAILHDPTYLILDEPTDGLDPNQKLEVRRLLNDLSSDKAVILSTHILEEVEAMCSRIIIIDKGKIVANATKDDLLIDGQSLETIFVQLTNPEATKAA